MSAQYPTNFSSIPDKIMKQLELLLLLFLAFLAPYSLCFQNFDFIIVGGGTAGLAVARRLVESGRHSVLVLESGNVPKQGMDVPALALDFLEDPDVTFRYNSRPQNKAGLHHPNGQFSLRAGRTLGGSSHVNYMYFNRGHPKDYDNWANITNDSSWQYSNLLPLFKKIETYNGEYPSEQHGYNGAITVTRPKYSPGLDIWLEAGKQLGYPIKDPNGPQHISFAKFEFSKRFGRRESSLKGYIEPVLKSYSNLKIILNTNVTKVVSSGWYLLRKHMGRITSSQLFEGKRAVGVQFQSTSPDLNTVLDHCLYANKEVIISAGVYGSPPILQRSGIGPRHLLKSAGIPVVQDLPVGNNFHDHLYVYVPVVLNSRHAVQDPDRDLTNQTWKYFLKTGDGPYSSTNGGVGQAFMASSVAKSNGESDWADIHFTPVHNMEAYFTTPYMNGSRDRIAPWEGPMMSAVILGRPFSRGTVYLNPNDPNGVPLINGGYLEDKRDVQILIDGLKEVVRIYESTPAYQNVGARLPPVTIPACRRFPYRSDLYWECYVRYMTETGYHPAGSCKMGQESDPSAVVDSELRVIGVRGLRVVDASVMPAVVNANPQVAVYLIAEKASESILKTWGTQANGISSKSQNFMIYQRSLGFSI